MFTDILQNVLSYLLMQDAPFNGLPIRKRIGKWKDKAWYYQPFVNLSGGALERFRHIYPGAQACLKHRPA